MSLACPHCEAPVPDASIDRERDLATCGACGRVIDLLAQARPRDPTIPPPVGRLRDPVALPANMHLEAEGPRDGSVTITRRWLRGKHYGLLVILLALSGATAFAWVEYGPSLSLVLATGFVLFWDQMLLGMFLNRTVIRAGGGKVDVTHGPLPSLVFRNRSVPASELRQLFAARHGAVFSVKAQLADGSVEELVWPLVTAEQAIFVEQQLERVLGLVDFEVPGELGAGPAAARAGQGSKASIAAAVVAALGPIAIGGAVLAVFFATTESVLQGSLVAGGALGSAVFTPDGCTSGQRAGFLGVELTSAAAPGRRIRLVRDSVRGNLALVEDAAQSRPTVLDTEACRTFDLTVTQTDTSLDDIWLVDGSVTLDCDLLSGSVTFAGCH